MPYHFAISELLQVRDGIILLGGGRDGRTVHCPDLCLGVSIGKEPHHNHHHKHNSPPTGAWTTHWKCVQTAGRVGRDMSQPAAYITVVEKKSFARGRLSDLSLCRYPNRDSIIIQTST